MKVLLLVISILTLTRWGEAHSQDPFANGRRFDINNILGRGRCPGPVPRATLNVGSDGRIQPTPSSYAFTFPGGSIPLTTQMQLLNRLGQDLNEDAQSTTPRSGAVRFDVQQVCDFAQVGEAEERPSFRDFVGTLRQRYIQENLTDSSLSIYTDNANAYNRTLESIDCRADVDWLDAGTQIFPRYYQSGFCRGRRCSIPDRSNFICRPDLTNPAQMGEISAYQWDCCWVPFRMGRRAGQRFDCGWRQITIPIVCDCDCDCGAEETPLPF